MSTLEEQIRTLSKRLERLENLEAIRNVLERYGRALDWLDAEALEPIFFDDASVDYGVFSGSGKDFKRELMVIENTFPKRWHFSGSPVISFHDDRSAAVESWQIAVSSQSDNISDPFGVYYGWYLDEFVKREGRWGIIRRKHVLSGITFANEGELPEVLSSLNRLFKASPKHDDYRPMPENEPPK